MRRVRSGENVADLGTKPRSKAVIAKHCLAMGYVKMNEEIDENECRIVAMFLDFESAAGDNVQTAASRGSQQQKQPQYPQQRQQADQQVNEVSARSSCLGS